MRRLKAVTLVAMAMMLIGITVSAQAETFPVVGDVTVSTDISSGIVTVVTADAQDAQQFVKMRQFCPDAFLAGAPFDLTTGAISREGNTIRFQLDMGGVKNGQISFNFISDCGKWLHIPDCHVNNGANTLTEWSEYRSNDPHAGGTHFTAFAFIPGYQPRNRLVATGGGCGGKSAYVAPPTMHYPSKPAISAGGGGGGSVRATASGEKSMAIAAKGSAVVQQRAKGDNNVQIGISQRGSTLKKNRIDVKGDNNCVGCTNNTVMIGTAIPDRCFTDFAARYLDPACKGVTGGSVSQKSPPQKKGK